MKGSGEDGRVCWRPLLALALAALAVGLAVAAALVPRALAPPQGTETSLFFDGVRSLLPLPPPTRCSADPDEMRWGQECNLCDGFVNFVADTDVAAAVKFGAIQKHVRKLGQRGAPTDLSTLVLVQGDAVRPRPSALPLALCPTTATLPHPDTLP